MSDNEPTSNPTDFEFADATQASDNPLSVALFFYIISACALFLACIRSVGSVSESGETVWYFLLIGLAIGLVSSLLLTVALMRWKDVPLTGIMGCIIGVSAGALALVQAGSHLELLVIAFGGCWLQIAVNCIAARFR